MAMSAPPASPIHEPPANPGTPKSILKKGPTTHKNHNDVKLVLDGNVPEAEQQPDSPRHTKTKQFVEGKDGVVKRGERRSVNGLQPITAHHDNNNVSHASEDDNDSDSDSDKELKKEEHTSPRNAISRNNDKNAIQPRASSSATPQLQVNAVKDKESAPASPRGAVSPRGTTSSPRGIFSKVFGKKKDKKDK